MAVAPPNPELIAARVIATAKAEIGYHEGRTGSTWNNHQKYSPAVPGLEWSQNQAWCATFISWVAMTAGVADIFPCTASTDAAAAWYKARKRWSEYPAIGAQGFLGTNGDMHHTFLVTGYDDTYVYTVEGNTNTNGSPQGDGVYALKRVRRATEIQGYGYPAYPEGISSADPAWKVVAPVAKTARLTLAVGNIRSTPRMTADQEVAATKALFGFAARIGAEVVAGNEIDHPSLRKVWRSQATGYTTYGAAPGSENTVSVRGSWRAASSFVRWLSAGVSKVTPRRTATVTNLVGPNGIKVKIMATHLVSEWQPYAKPKTGATWSIRSAIASRSISRIGKRVNQARKAGWVVIVVGDLNALTAVKFTDGQIQLLGTGPAAGGNLGKMLQAAAFAPVGTTVRVLNRWTQKPTATDHPYRAVQVEVSR